MHCFDKLYKKTKPYLKKIKRKITPKSQVKVLLLTNRDSDNVGDQVIEATDISLISTVMKNLGLHRWEYEIISKAVSFVSQGYLKNRNPKLLEPAEKAIRNCDIVVFGGAPMFNYMYQNFYERTAVTIEIAQKYQKPVFFSAIGLEHYDEQNKKCQRLKKALNLDCVKMITTRDDFEMLQKYKEKESLYIDKVADPAVHTCTVFRKFWIQKKPGRKKKIGIFILREGGFTDNKIPFSKEEAIAFWTKVIEIVKQGGYDYEILTSGHFSDEAFVDRLVREYGFPLSKCVFNMNTPEYLISKIADCDGVISCRLHPSIISFSLDVPSVGIMWNAKVKGFYDSIGYGNRVFDVIQEKPEELVDRLELAMKEGIQKDETYLMSIYQSLFTVMKEQIKKNSNASPYPYRKMVSKMVCFKGTSRGEKEEKIKRKFRRVYAKYNKVADSK